MCKKGLIVLLSAMLCLATSCVDKNYDLANKEITTDVKLEGNVIAFPVGNLKAVMLDSLIDLDEIELLGKNAEGIYSITTDSTFSVEESIDSITLNIAPFEYNDTVDFNKVSIEDVHIAGNDTSAVFAPPTISIDNLNDKLPRLKSYVSKRFFSEQQLEKMLEIFEKSPIPIETYPYTFSEPLKVSTDTQKVACSIDYEIPFDIETIKSIRLGSKNLETSEIDTIGTLVRVKVTNPAVLGSCDKSISFRIDFPDIFYLATNTAADQSDKYKIVNGGHSIELNGFVPDGNKTTELSFYIQEVKKFEDKINEYNRIQIADSIAYFIDYTLSGEMELRKDMNVNDFAFDVDLDVQLYFYDAAGKTKDVKVDFEEINMNFECQFDELENIDKICSVEFDETQSKLVFSTKMDKEWLDAFSLAEGYALKVEFPKSLYIDADKSQYVGEYKADEHAFYITDLDSLASSHWELALDSLVLNLDVEDGTGVCNLKEKATVGFVSPKGDEDDGCFYLAGLEMESMVEILNKLNNGNKKAEFKMDSLNLVIEEAVVVTNTVNTDLTATAKFDINEKIPSEIKRIENIGFEKDVLISLKLDVDGLDDLNADINLNVNMSLPSFLKLEAYDKTQGISVNDNGLLSINTVYNPLLHKEEPFLLNLWCTGIDFRTQEFGNEGLVPTLGDDGNSYISYNHNIEVNGEASVTGAEFSSKVLEKDVYLNVLFEVEEISVKTFHGIYSAEIDSVEEKIDFDLGDELAFLRDEGNSLTLADPQLELSLTNPVGIPVDIDLQIYGYDEDSVLIEESKIEEKLSILPAKYDNEKDKLEAVETKLFITTDTLKNKKAGYKNVEIKNLANLLKRVPYSISLNVKPEVRTDATHHVDISEPIKLDAAYSVVVPLKFDSLSICYSDTITGLKADLGETLEMFSNVSLCVKMDLINTIPLGLSLKLVPLDENGDVIEDIEIDKLVIEAGSGENLLASDGSVNGNLGAQHFVFGIKSKSGDVSKLDQLAFVVEAASNHTTGSAGLRGEQGVKISNIVFEVSGDIEVDLNEMDF